MTPTLGRLSRSYRRLMQTHELVARTRSARALGHPLEAGDLDALDPAWVTEAVPELSDDELELVVLLHEMSYHQVLGVTAEYLEVSRDDLRFYLGELTGGDN
jgi:hypothetical protein